ncbi:MAG: rubrerythrin family protein [Dehalococcoidia bacterium]|jgi:rubrerythrin|nr:MAG: rubrerythrin family protein [Dehalococcoidia bacterium]
MAETPENLQAAFAGESQANRRYTFSAEKADQEGQPQIARLFRAAAEAETVHARNHFIANDMLGKTRDNLLAAVAGEHHEFTSMYPGFIKLAELDGNERAVKTFKYANEVEKIHHALYEQALKALEAGQKLKEEPYFICPVCGNTVAGQVPDRCPICATPGAKFKRID